MKKILIILVVLCLVSAASATVVNFDDLATNQNQKGMLWDAIPLNYQGLQWTPQGDDGWNVNSGTTYKSVYNNSYGAVSNDNFASNSAIAVASVNGLFDFAGAYFSTWAQNDAFQSWSSTSVAVTGYNGTTLIGSTSMNLSSTGFNWLSANFIGIDKLEITASQGTWWIMDDFTYTPVPEPATLALLGLGGLLLRRKRKTG